MIATYIILGLNLIAIGIHVGKHGENMKQKYNGWSKLTAVIIIFGLYYYAGLFENL